MNDINDFNNKLIEELVKQDDGVNPNSPFPIADQLEARRNYYAQKIELKWFRERIKTGIEALLDENEDLLDVKMAEQIFSAASQEASNLKGERGERALPKLLGGNHKTIFAVGKRYLEADHFQESAGIFTLLTMLEPSAPSYWFCLGLAEQNCGNYEQAALCFKTAHGLNENDILSSLLEVECLLAQGYEEEAAQRFDQIDKKFQLSPNLSLSQTKSLNALKQKLERRLKQWEKN